MSFHINVLIDAQTRLGECPRYDYRDQSLWFVDIVGKTLYRYGWEEQTLDSREFDEEIGCFGFCVDGGMILGMQTGFYYVSDGLKGAPEPITNPEEAMPWQRMNDGRCGPDGLFYAGSVNPKKDKPSAALYCLENGTTRVIDDGFMTFNGLVFDKDQPRVLYADTPQHIIYQAQWDMKKRVVENRHTFAQFAVGRGRPDGAVQDAKGNIWTALYDGYAIVKLSRDGDELDRIPIPCKYPTALCFAGPEFKTLIVTTARQGHSDADLSMYPKAGAVFALDVDAVGTKEYLVECYR